MKDLTKKKYVYESPDCGNTVYAREIGSNQRRLIKSSSLHSQLQKQQLWRDILQEAETDQQLRHLVDQVEIFWRLKHESRN